MSTTYTLLLEPIDVLSFRDYRGLEPGEQHDVGTLFPTPTVMLGAVRGALFRAAGADFTRREPGYGVDERHYRDWLGGPTPEEHFSLTVRGPWLATGLTGERPSLWLPRPLHVKVKEPFKPDDHGVLAPRFHKAPARATTLSLKPPGAKDDEGSWYARATDPDCVQKEGHFIERERRVGIARNLGTRSVEAGLFYLQDTLRFAEGAGLAVEVDTQSGKHEELLKRLHQQAIPLGGRGHHVRVTVKKGTMRPQGASTGRRVWCLTPMPLDKERGLVLPDPARLAALHAGPPYVVGGFDRAQGRPHPLTRVLPAGTVITLSEDLTSASSHDWGMSDTQKRAGYGVTQLLGDTPS
jgi:CRISPR type III-B/RAMP module-associated protein Cmr3